jgi:hypothetical protein
MYHRRHTITVASSTLFFVCLVLHARTGLYCQASTPNNDAEARKVYESLLPADWTVTVAHARRFLIQAQTGSSTHTYIVLSHVAFSMDKTTAAIGTRLSYGAVRGADTFYLLESKDGIWNSMQWRGTSRAWAS